MIYLLDTDTLTHLHAGNIKVINRIESLQDEEIAITIITKVEILRGRIDYLLNLIQLTSGLLLAPLGKIKTVEESKACPNLV